MKAQLRHSGDARRKRNEGADHGQQAPEQNGDGAVLLEEVRHAVEVVMAHQHPAAVALDQRTTARGADPVRNHGAKVAADGAGRGDPEKAEASRVDQVAGEGHDDFAGERDAGRFDAHQGGNAGVSQ